MSLLGTSMRKVRGFVMRTFPGMITCEELEEFIVDYLEGTLPKRQRMSFEVHLRVCPECRAYLADYKHAMSVTAATFDELRSQLSNEIPEELVQAILAVRNANK